MSDKVRITSTRRVDTEVVMVDPDAIMVGLVSCFGGPQDDENSIRPGLALHEPSEMGQGYVDPYGHPLFTKEAVDMGMGPAEALDPDAMYCAMRWDYSITSRLILQSSIVAVTAEKTQKTVMCRPVDFGPHVSTGRILDVSPGAMARLGVETDDIVTVIVFRP